MSEKEKVVTLIMVTEAGSDNFIYYPSDKNPKEYSSEFRAECVARELNSLAKLRGSGCNYSIVTVKKNSAR